MIIFHLSAKNFINCGRNLTNRDCPPLQQLKKIVGCRELFLCHKFYIFLVVFTDQRFISSTKEKIHLIESIHSAAEDYASVTLSSVAGE
jgi:hypothetical protein